MAVAAVSKVQPGRSTGLKPPVFSHTVMSEKKMEYEKSKRELEILEKEFQVELLPRLNAAAGGKDSLLFCTSELNQFQQGGTRGQALNVDKIRRMKSLEAEMSLLKT